MRFTIKQKLATTFGAIIVLSGIAAYVGTSSLATIENSMNEVLGGPVTRLEKLNDIEITYMNMMRNDLNLIVSADETLLKHFEEQSRKLRGQLLSKLEDYSSHIILAANRAKFDEIRKLAAEYIPIQEKILENGKHDTNAEALQIAEKEGHTDEFVMMLRPLREHLAGARPAQEAVDASMALGDIVALLRDIEIRQRDSILATTDASVAAFNKQIGDTISAITKQRDIFQRLPDAQDRALAT